MEKRADNPKHSLELNLILLFIFEAGKPFGLIERDIIESASSNRCKYLTAF
jgi:hypothetical protein